MRALILSDIHANLDALEAVLAAAPPHDTVWNLGDSVGYGANPNEVIDRVRARGVVIVAQALECQHMLPVTQRHCGRLGEGAAAWAAAVMITPAAEAVDADADIKDVIVDLDLIGAVVVPIVDAGDHGLDRPRVAV